MSGGMPAWIGNAESTRCANECSVPIAAVRLAQGVGRLIRSTGDKGVVAVLDSRLETARGYGAFLRKSLPPFWYTTRPEVAVGALQRLTKS